LTSLTPFLLIGFLLICTVGVIKIYGEEPDEWIWATNDIHGTRAVPIYYVDQPMANTEHGLIEAMGTWNPNTDIIELKKDMIGKWIQRACDIRTHEILHAFGYNEAELKEFDCPNPDADYDRLQYNPNFVKHWNPNYVWSGY
jgi:ribosomal protein S16